MSNHSLSTSINFYRQILSCYEGNYERKQPRLLKSVGDLLLPAYDGVVESITSSKELLKLDGVVKAVVHYREGDHIKYERTSGFCSGYVQVEGVDSVEVENRMRSILSKFSLKMKKVVEVC